MSEGETSSKENRSANIGSIKKKAVVSSKYGQKTTIKKATSTLKF